MRSLLVAVMVLAALPLAAQGKGGAGDLMVMPTRVLLEGRERTAEVMLRNSGKDTCTYRVFFQEMRMLPSGKVEVMAKAEGVVTAADLVRFTPRQVQLLPGETQTVRLQLRKPEGLAAGEYRSHLVFQGLPPVEPPKPLVEGAEKSLSFDIRTLVSLSIPVIVRHGETAAAIELTGLALRPEARPEDVPSLELTLGRQGNRSVQGELKVEWLPRSGRSRVLLPVQGAVLYTTVAARTLNLELPDAKGVTLRAGKVKVTYTFKDFKRDPVVAYLDVP